MDSKMDTIPEGMNTACKTSWLEIKALLRKLGATPNYRGYWQLGQALYLASEQPEMLTLVNKWLYAEVAKNCNTTKQSVERNVRTLIHRIWTVAPESITSITGFSPSKEPTSAEFLSALIIYLELEVSAKH